MEDVYWYHVGFKNRQAAEDTLEQHFATGEVSPSEGPRIERYYVTSRTPGANLSRFGIKLTAEW